MKHSHYLEFVLTPKIDSQYHSCTVGYCLNQILLQDHYCSECIEEHVEDNFMLNQLSIIPFVSARATPSLSITTDKTQ